MNPQRFVLSVLAILFLTTLYSAPTRAAVTDEEVRAGIKTLINGIYKARNAEFASLLQDLLRANYGESTG